jgi:integrase
VSVYRRGRVYWFDFWFRGRRYRETTGLNNKTAALRVEAIRKAELAENRAGIVKPKFCPGFADFVKTEFLPWSEMQHMDHPATHRAYHSSTKVLTGFFGNVALDAISSGDVERFKVRRATEVTGATTNRTLTALRVVLKLAIRQGYLTRNPVSGVKALAEGSGSMRIVSFDEQEKYLAAASPKLRDIATIMLETGMRPEEVCTIRLENVHLPERYLFIPRGKSRCARRNIPLTSVAVQVLERRLRESKGPYVFPARLDPSAPVTQLLNVHNNALAKAKITPRFRLYDLRHTFGSRSAMAGVDLPTLKELMGHANIAMTMRYVHPTAEHKVSAVRKLEEYQARALSRSSEEPRVSPQISPQGAS